MSDIFVNISGIPGEATDTGYAAQIKCDSMRHAVAHTIRSVGARKVGNSRHGAIELTHKIDKASPLLRIAAADANNKGTVTITRTGSSGVMETITLTNVYVVRVSVDTPVHPDTLIPDKQDPIETFALEYDRITWEYHWYNSAGVDQGAVTGAWDVSSNSVPS